MGYTVGRKQHVYAAHRPCLEWFPGSWERFCFSLGPFCPTDWEMTALMYPSIQISWAQNATKWIVLLSSQDVYTWWIFTRCWCGRLYVLLVWKALRFQVYCVSTKHLSLLLSTQLSIAPSHFQSFPDSNRARTLMFRWISGQNVLRQPTVYLAQCPKKYKPVSNLFSRVYSSCTAKLKHLDENGILYCEIDQLDNLQWPHSWYVTI